MSGPMSHAEVLRLNREQGLMAENDCPNCFGMGREGFVDSTCYTSYGDYTGARYKTCSACKGTGKKADPV